MANSEVNPFQYLIAGPCAAESELQVLETARQLQSVAGSLPYPIAFFRAGVWKPRSSGADFSGVGKRALPWLQRVTRDYGFPVCVEVANPKHVEACLQHDIANFWIGARTAVNPFIVQEIAESLRGVDAVVMVKNPAIPDLKLWLGNVQRFEKIGVNQVFAIHRGFVEQKENVLRNAPMWEIAIAFKVARPDIPLLCDPSHIAGNKRYIKQIAQIAVDYGCNGLMLETHCSPQFALSDAAQQISPVDFLQLLKSLVFRTSSTNPDDLLRQQRALIRNIDSQIGQLLAKRMSVVEEISRIKQENSIPLLQAGQWNSVVENYKQNALSDSEFAEFLDKYLELLHHYSLQRQTRK